MSFLKNGKAQLRVWAPEIEKVQLYLPGNEVFEDLQYSHPGYWTIQTNSIEPGDDYQICLDNRQFLADPASLHQPYNVHGPSRAFDTNIYNWQDTDWHNPVLKDYIIYELHAGTFSEQASFQGIASKLAYLKELGINAIEIMPVAQFPGDRNWGYDGVFPFAVQDSYGGPSELQRLIDSCHQHGLAVILDVVYNHLGPEGNYLSAFAPYFTDKYQTPWGKAINFDDVYCDGVRKFFIENALMWFRDFHVDALRLDAVHAIKDLSAHHFLAELSEHTACLSKLTNKEYYLIAECDLNDPKYITSVKNGGYGLHTQWIDEFHHALRVSAGENAIGYYADFKPVEHLAKSYEDAYVYDGQYSEHRKRHFGAKVHKSLGEKFIVFSQNHDQTGNRMLGERSYQLYGFEIAKVLSAAVLTSPYIPMLFMGEEFCTPNPFLYFVSHSDEQLIEAVRKGRAKEFEAFHQAEMAPDPQNPETFLRSKIDWDCLNSPEHQTMLNWYKHLIRMRKDQPGLLGTQRDNLTVSYDTENALLWIIRQAGSDKILICMNFSLSRKDITCKDPNICDSTWHPLLYSAEEKWMGKANKIPEIRSGKIQAMEAASVIIFKN
ncbi:MAG: malto-oligosyltrehalose trehalohydrolase [Cyclobacteriaceae bacterium]|nr:malto-oligosyltrehalose trehalohydrolase [Cyclobacteriaceae bacterium]